MYLHVQKWAVKLVLFRGCLARDRKSPERGNVANQFSSKEVNFARSLLEKQHEFNGTSLEVNRIRQSFYLGRHVQQKFAKLFTKSSRNKRRSFSISLSFYQTNILSSPKSRDMLDVKKLF